MKKLMIIGLGAIALSSCAGESENTTSKTYEEKVKEVCSCFEDKAAAGEAPQDCFMLQDKLSKSVGDDKKQSFIQETNECSN